MAISDQVRRGIKLACIKENTTITRAAKDSGVPRSSIYRYMSGSTDIYITKMDRFCRLGLGRTLAEVMELGK